MARNQKSKIKRAIVAKTKGQKLHNPSRFLSPQRLDIAAKTIFARAYLEGNTSNWPEYVYKEHIRAFNGFYEKEPLKVSYADFRDSFLKTIESVRDDDAWKHLAPIQYSDRYLVNGAHRVAASITTGDKINTERPKEAHEDIYDYRYFMRNQSGIDAIDTSVLDSMTIEYVSLKKRNIFAAIIFPTAEGLRQEAYEHLLQLGEIVNMKTFKHDEFIGKEVIKQLYFNSNNDAWNYGLSFDSAKNKANLCFAGTGDLQVYILEANLKESTRIKEKQYLRDLWKKDKHSVHITDTIEEANRVVRMFFNENSRRLMTIDRPQEFASQAMYTMFGNYLRHLPRDVLEREKYAIEGSAVLDLLNIRTGRDIDYISRAGAPDIVGDSIERHTGKENQYHSESIDEILTDPRFFFYYKGVKFVDIVEIERYKEHRLIEQNQKDDDDLMMIKSFMRQNPAYHTGEYVSAEAPLVSIIVPVYNTAEVFLTKCLDSIKAQDYDNIEVIIVDDGSNKQTNKVLDSYVNQVNDGGRSHRWRVIHQKHSGLSHARNEGYHLARGVYIQFLDSDDYIYRRFITSVVDRAESTGADIVLENFTIRDFETDVERGAFQADQFPQSPVFRLVDLEGSRFTTIPYSTWSNLYRKEFLSEHTILHDVTLKRAEDILFSCSALVVAEKIAVQPALFMTHRDAVPASNSMTNDMFPLASVDAWRKLYDTLVDGGIYDEFRDDFSAAAVESIAWHYRRLAGVENKVKLARYAMQFFDETAIRLANDDYLNLSLGAIDHHLIELVDAKISAVERQSQLLIGDNAAIHQELNLLRKPGVRLASLKLAGAVKRKIKKASRSRRN